MDSAIIIIIKLCWLVMSSTWLMTTPGGGHIALTYPPARRFALDYLTNNDTDHPCGMPADYSSSRTDLEAGSTITVEWKSTYLYWIETGYLIDLLDGDDDVIPGGVTMLQSSSALTHRVRISSSSSDRCSVRCALRISLHPKDELLPNGEKFYFRSCANIRVVQKSAYEERCSGKGEFNVDTQKCVCETTYKGDLCQHKDDCVEDVDCTNHGKCLDTESPHYPQKVCFCQPGWHGTYCERVSALRNTTIKYEDYSKVDLSQHFQFYHRLINNDEVEIVLRAKTKSWVALGWRPNNLTPRCKDLSDINSRGKRDILSDSNSTSITESSTPSTIPLSTNPTLDASSVTIIGRSPPSTNIPNNTISLLSETPSPSITPPPITFRTTEATPIPSTPTTSTSSPSNSTASTPSPSTSSATVPSPPISIATTSSPSTTTARASSPSITTATTSSPSTTTASAPSPATSTESTPATPNITTPTESPLPSTSSTASILTSTPSISNASTATVSAPTLPSTSKSTPSPQTSTTLKPRPPVSAITTPSQTTSTTSVPRRPTSTESTLVLSTDSTTRPSTSTASTTKPSPSAASTTRPSTSTATTPRPSPSTATTTRPSTSSATTTRPSTSSATTTRPTTSSATTTRPSSSTPSTTRRPTSTATTTSRPTSTASTARPSTPSPTQPAPITPDPLAGGLHGMECTDMVIGMARGDLGRVGDYYSRDRSTPQLDEFFGGSPTLTGAVGFEDGEHTVIVFRRKITASDHTDHSFATDDQHVIWAIGQTNDEFYQEDILQFHGMHKGQVGMTKLALGKTIASSSSDDSDGLSTVAKILIGIGCVTVVVVVIICFIRSRDTRLKTLKGFSFAMGDNPSKTKRDTDFVQRSNTDPPRNSENIERMSRSSSINDFQSSAYNDNNTRHGQRGIRPNSSADNFRKSFDSLNGSLNYPQQNSDNRTPTRQQFNASQQRDWERHRRN